MSAAPSLPSFAHTFNATSRIMSPPDGAGSIALPPIRSGSHDDERSKHRDATRPGAMKRTNSDTLAHDHRKRSLARDPDAEQTYRGRYATTNQQRHNNDNPEFDHPEHPSAPRGSQRSHTSQQTPASLQTRTRVESNLTPSTSTDRPNKRRRTGNTSGPSSPVTPMSATFPPQRGESSSELQRSIPDHRRESTIGGIESPRLTAGRAGPAPPSNTASPSGRPVYQPHPSDRHPTPPPRDEQRSSIPNTLPLPPPPTSFTRRRAMALESNTGSGSTASPRKRAPADIVISPRSPPSSHSHLRVSSMSTTAMVQSAPAIPRPGQLFGYAQQTGPPRGLGVGSAGVIALPSIPTLQNPSAYGTRRILPALVPPTPTRLSALSAASTTAAARPNHGRAESTAHVAISSTLSGVPATPTTLRHRLSEVQTAASSSSAQPSAATSSSSGDKAGFLAPFETFYDALVDAKHLKSWLSEQLTRSNSMMDKMEERMEEMVQKRVHGLFEEVNGLKRRVSELEGELDARVPRSGTRDSVDAGHRPVNGHAHAAQGQPTPPQSFTFPRRPSRADIRSEHRPYSPAPHENHHLEGRHLSSHAETDGASYSEADRRQSVSTHRQDSSNHSQLRSQTERDWHAKPSPHNSPRQTALRPGLQHKSSSSSVPDTHREHHPHHTTADRRPAAGSPSVPSEHTHRRPSNDRSRPQTPMDVA